jgi:hypothetical protein
MKEKRMEAKDIIDYPRYGGHTITVCCFLRPKSTERRDC